MPLATKPTLAQKRAARESRRTRLLANRQDFVIPLLARRSFHLPGNTVWQDWWQWFCNNHLLFGICLHHPLHPVEWWERVLALVASVSFGLVATNFVYELYQTNWHNMEAELVSVGDYAITKGMLLLWTLGGLCHSIFDMALWKIMACACCHPGGFFGTCLGSSLFQNCGSYLLVPVIFLLLSLAVYFVRRRAVYEEQDTANDSGAVADDDLYSELQDTPYFFLFRYGVEMLLAWFVYFPVVGTVLFSGILGCGQLPVLGGRPRDKRLVEEQSMEYRRFG